MCASKVKDGNGYKMCLAINFERTWNEAEAGRTDPEREMASNSRFQSLKST
jgi:hypothetical protein